MKITLNAIQYADQVTGTDRIAANVISNLQDIDHENSYQVVCMAGRPYIADLIHAPNFRVSYVKSRSKASPAFWSQIISKKLKLLVDRPDLYFSFHNMTVPAFKYSKIVSSNLDLIPLHFPEQYMAVLKKFPLVDRFVSDSTRTKVYRKELERTVKLADHFVAISQFSKEDLHSSLGVPLDKITVAHLAAEPRFRDPVPQAVITKIKAKYKLPEHYILTIGSTEPRKNVKTVLAAYDQLPDKLKEQFALVVVGKPWHYVKESDLGGDKKNNIYFTGYLPEEDVTAVYQGADLFVFASLYEGFGIPVLEAMASGIPVICSNTTSLPEVAGPAARMVDPTDIKAVTQAMGDLLEDEGARAELIKMGRVQEQKFTWRKTAEVYHEVFRKVLNGQ